MILEVRDFSTMPPGRTIYLFDQTSPPIPILAPPFPTQPPGSPSSRHPCAGDTGLGGVCGHWFDARRRWFSPAPIFFVVCSLSHTSLANMAHGPGRRNVAVVFLIGTVFQTMLNFSTMASLYSPSSSSSLVPPPSYTTSSSSPEIDG